MASAIRPATCPTTPTTPVTRPTRCRRDGRRLLFGHTHQHTKPGRAADSLHVGLDSWDLRPVSETQIMQWFDGVRH